MGRGGAHLAEEDEPEVDPEAELEADDLELDREDDLLVPAELEPPPESLAILATFGLSRAGPHGWKAGKSCKQKCVDEQVSTRIPQSTRTKPQDAAMCNSEIKWRKGLSGRASQQ